MRIIAGRYRGISLAAPPGETTRPVTDRVKETLFNMLGSRLATPGLLPPIEVLDLFAGAGSFGFEALSRGAARVTLVERAPRALRTLRENASKLGAGEDGVHLIAGNAWTMRLPKPRLAAHFGVIFVDPPYKHATDSLGVASLFDRLVARLAPEGVIVFRHGPGATLDLSTLPELTITEARTYGEMFVYLVRHAEKDHASHWTSDA